MAEFTPGAVAAACGVKAEEISLAARMFGQAKAPLSLWCQGLNQSIHGTSNGAAQGDLQLPRRERGGHQEGNPTGADLATLQEKLKCGTSCGSCVPEIKRMLTGQPDHR